MRAKIPFYIIPILFCSSAVSVQAAMYYVATTGNDANICTQAQNISTPKRTLNNAVNCLTAGDTLYIRGGTYNEEINNRIPSGLSPGQPTVLSRYQSEIVTLKPTMVNSTRIIIIGAGKEYITLDGLILDAGDVQAVALEMADVVPAPRYVTLKNSTVKNAHASGVFASGSFHKFQNNIVENSGHNEYEHGLYGPGSNALIEGNIFRNNSGYGIHQFSSGGGPLKSNDNVYRNNVFYNNPAGGLIMAMGSRNQAYNNVFYDNGEIAKWQGTLICSYHNPNCTLSDGWGGIRTFIANDIKIFNNTVYSNLNGIFVHTDATNVQVRNNIVWNNTQQAIINTGPSTTFSNNLCGAAGTGCTLTTADPKFVNAAAFDFHLQSSSPAINLGMNLYADGVTTDFANIGRPASGAFEIGAYEYGGSPGPTPTPSPTPSPTASISPMPTTCSNPTPIPSGFASPCPVFSVSPRSGSLSQNFTVSLTPDASKTVWIYKTMYITEGSTWKSIALPGTIQYQYWLQGNISNTFTPSSQSLTPGAHYLASWDWTWDATAQCYKGPGATACGGGQYRIQQISVQ